MTDVLEVNRPEVVAAVRAAFERYERALETNDVAVLDDTFWDDARTLRYGVAEILHGHAAIAAYRASRTPVQHAGRARRLENTLITTFGDSFAVANTEYVLLRDPGLRGRQSQSWVRMADGWKVVAAHVSVIAAT